jgi:MFS family permease
MSPSEEATHRKVTWRLLPFLFLCYVLAYLDRVNVGFAKLQVQKDLGFSDTVYGIDAGVFFVGYFLFEVPSNLILERVGARLWIARSMILWGMLSSVTMFVTGERTFYALRLALGVAEAGFFPGIILYLTYWYTRKHRARMVVGFMIAVALSGVIGGPISGFILSSLSGVSGLAGSQWLYLSRGPSVGGGRSSRAVAFRRRPFESEVAHRRREGASGSPSPGRRGAQDRGGRGTSPFLPSVPKPP